MLSSDNYRVFEITFREPSASAREEFFNELEAHPLRRTEDFKRNPYFVGISLDENQMLEKYLWGIFENVLSTENKFKRFIEKETPNDRDELRAEIEFL